jgi:hypothetical protein
MISPEDEARFAAHVSGGNASPVVERFAGLNNKELVALANLGLANESAVLAWDGDFSTLTTLREEVRERFAVQRDEAILGGMVRALHTGGGGLKAKALIKAGYRSPDRLKTLSVEEIEALGLEQHRDRLRRIAGHAPPVA